MTDNEDSEDSSENEVDMDAIWLEWVGEVGSAFVNLSQ